MCARLGVELVVERAAGTRRVDFQRQPRGAGARGAPRFSRARRRAKSAAGYLALGHHRDDQAETVLMRLMRGAGAAGMAAMAEHGPGRLIRPMLSISRAEIRGYLDARATAFVEDSTNSSRDILRNRIRAELLPMLEREYARGLAGGWWKSRPRCAHSTSWSAAIAARELDAMRRRGGALDVSGFSGVNRAVQTGCDSAVALQADGIIRGISRAHIEAMRQLILAGGPSD